MIDKISNFDKEIARIEAEIKSIDESIVACNNFANDYTNSAFDRREAEQEHTDYLSEKSKLLKLLEEVKANKGKLKKEKFPNQGYVLYGILKSLVDYQDLPDAKAKYEISHNQSRIDDCQTGIDASFKRESNNEVDPMSMPDELTLRVMLNDESRDLQEKNNKLKENMEYAKKFYATFYPGIIREAEKQKRR